MEVVEFRTKYYKDKMTEKVGNISEDGMARIEREIEEQVRREELIRNNTILINTIILIIVHKDLTVQRIIIIPGDMPIIFVTTVT